MITADTIELSKVVGLVRNPKSHDIGEISGSLNRFGILERIVINGDTGHLIAGHGRIETLRRMKARGSAPPKSITISDGEWLVPCDYVSLPEEEEEAAAIALNRLTEIGGWDEPTLARVLSDLAARGDGALDGVGFDTDDLDELIRDMSDDSSTQKEEPEIDETEDLIAKWNCKIGDRWVVGDHVVICGDCTDSSVEIGMVNLVFTSPPYAEQRKKQYGGIPADQYVDWWAGVQTAVRKNLMDDGSFFVNIKPHSEESQRNLYVFDLVCAMVRRWNWLFVDEFCWPRVSAPGSWPNRFKNGFEPVYHFAKSKSIKFRPHAVSIESSGSSRTANNKNTGNYFNTDGSIEWETALPSNMLDSFGNTRGIGHPAAFPVGLPEFFVLAFSDESDTVLDPFAGSGTTAVAAARNDRKSVSIEIDPKYVAIILERLSNEIGEEPERS